jgi:hypothetical protein
MVRIPEAIILDNGRVVGYVTEVSDAYGHQVFCYNTNGTAVHSFSHKEMVERGWKSSFDVALWFNQERGLG